MIEWILQLFHDGADEGDFWCLLAGLLGASETAQAFENGKASAPAAYCVVRAWNADGMVLVEYEHYPEKAERRRQDLNEQHPDWTVIVELAVV